MVREVARDAKWSENDRKSGCAERKDVHFHYIGSANGGLCEKLGFTDFGGSVGTETAFSSWRDGPWAPGPPGPLGPGGRRQAADLWTLAPRGPGGVGVRPKVAI